ncbi:fumarylacetoacetate hydrolase domain-containing protein 2 isoform X2 [Bacillus rossius redtenbacheri]|uniref:fumarylacetoacetate hydrolase domain-containing protein 2 isoform X2 n=1 Tax=Bacillus rossius redtenbacheri TaxID=93214 RepID=UPI002FDCFB25
MPIRRRCKAVIQSFLCRNQQHKLTKSYFYFSQSKTTQAGLFTENNRLCQIKSSRSFSTGTQLNMRFVQFTASTGGPQRLGVQLVQDGDIIDVSGVDSSIPNDLVQLLQGGPSVLERAKRVVAEGKSVLRPADVVLRAPVTAPGKVVCVGLNYSGHCDEQNVPYPKEPVFFSKFSSCIVGPYDDVRHAEITTALDWEVELALVMGRRAKDVKPVEAMEHVFGFTVAQDITARDWQKGRNGGQWLLGKSMDTFCPLGPAVVTKEAVGDVYALGIRSKVNGVLKQSGNTSELIHKIDYLVSFLSHCVTLLPGDVILTGTPAGVGVHRKPQEFLKPGDIIESEIDSIGRMKNNVV